MPQQSLAQSSYATLITRRIFIEEYGSFWSEDDKKNAILGNYDVALDKCLLHWSICAKTNG